MIVPEEVGNILARLAIADENFLVGALQSARKAGDAMLPGDAEKLEAWARFIQALRATIQNSEEKHKINVDCGKPRGLAVRSEV